MRVMTMMLALVTVVAAPVAAQDAGPKVGDMAPDFTVTVAGKDGVSDAPLTLSSLRGKTVVVAFYPRARTRGCTIQMEAYRDQYDSLFSGGRDVVLLPMSTDSAGALASWARDANFPFRMGSDPDGAVARRYASLANERPTASRVVFVIGPDGRIREIMRPFREIDPTAYTDLAAAIRRAR